MADFAYRPDFNYAISPMFNVLRVKFENNADQRRLKSSQKLRKLKLVFENRSADEMSAVKSFFDSKSGSFQSFTIEIDSETLTGIFVQDSFEYVRKAAGVYTYQFDFEEILT